MTNSELKETSPTSIGPGLREKGFLATSFLARGGHRKDCRPTSGTQGAGQCPSPGPITVRYDLCLSCLPSTSSLPEPSWWTFPDRSWLSPGCNVLDGRLRSKDWRLSRSCCLRLSR